MSTVLNIIFPGSAMLALVFTLTAMGNAPNPLGLRGIGGVKSFVAAFVCGIVAGFWAQCPHLLGNPFVGLVGIVAMLVGWLVLARRSEWLGVLLGAPGVYLLAAGVHSLVG